MKYRSKLLGAAGVCVALVGNANLVQNPGFESDLAQWTVELTEKIPSAIDAVPADPSADNPCVQLRFDGAYTPGVYSMLSQEIPVRPLSRYRISLKARSKAPENQPLYFGGGPDWSFRQPIDGGEFDWKEFSAEYVTGADETSFTLRFFLENQLRDLQIDDVKMERVYETTDVAGNSISAYGALPDGVTDSTEAFQKAFAAGHTTVRVPAGKFAVSSVLVPPGCTLQGDGSESALLPAPGFAEGALVRLSANARVRDLAFSGSVKHDAVSAVNVQSVAIENLTVRDLRYAVLFDHVTDGTIANCRAANVDKAFEVIFSDRLRIQNNNIADCRVHGIQFWGNYDWNPAMRNRDLIITGNIVRNGGAGAIWGTGYTDVIVANNLVDGATDVGIDLEWCEDSTITGNVVRNTENGGISLFFSCRRITIVGNTVINDRKFTTGLHEQFAIRAGIWLTYCNRDSFKLDSGHEDITILGNTLYNPDLDRRAMFIGSGSKRVRISGNSVNQGELWLGGEHNKPLVLEHIPNGEIFLDSQGEIQQHSAQ